MAHRDDLSAALARIAALERELKQTQHAGDEELRAERDRLAARVAELERKPQEQSPPESDAASENERELLVTRIRERLDALDAGARNRFLLAEASSAAASFDEREERASLERAVDVGERWLAGKVTLEQLADACDLAADVYAKASQAVYDAQVARSAALDAAAKATQASRDTSFISAALAAEDPSLRLGEKSRAASLVLAVLASFNPEEGDTDVISIVADALADDPTITKRL